MNIYSTSALSEELSHCDNLEDLKQQILPKLQEQRTAWQKKIVQIMDENDYSAKMLSQLCEVSVTSVRKWCKGSLPQSREMFIRIGFAAHYDVEQMNHFLQRYGRYPQLYARSLEDSVCLFLLSSENIPHTYQCYRVLIGRIRAEMNGAKIQNESYYSTSEITGWLLDMQDESEMLQFVKEHAGVYLGAYDKLYNYILAFLQWNRVNRVDATKISIKELAEQQNWSSSLRHCISQIRSKRWFPMRRKLISLGVHMNMDLDEINQMLQLAQMETLCTRNPEEAVLIYALEDARLNNQICCDGMDFLCEYVRNIFEQLDMEDAEYILDDL